MSADTAYGLCRCGCGEATRLAPQTSARRGWVRGTPVPYRPGHGQRGKPAWNRKSDVNYIVEDRGHMTPCWIWQLRLDRRGYAMSSVRSHPVRAARLYYTRHVGPIPDGLTIDHLCFVPACVNPAHLEPVTMAENSRRRRTSTITMEIADAIRLTSGRGVDVAARFGVSQQMVCDIRKGRRWAA